MFNKKILINYLEFNRTLTKKATRSFNHLINYVNIFDSFVQIHKIYFIKSHNLLTAFYND